MEYYTCLASLPVGRSVRVDTLLEMFVYPLAFHIGEFHNEVSDHLSLYGSVRVVLYIEFAQLNYP